MRAGLLTVALLFVTAAPAGAADGPDGALTMALAAAVPVDGSSDVVLVQMPFTPRAPHVWAATPVAAPPAVVKAVLLDPPHYRAVVPGLVRTEVHAEAARAGSSPSSAQAPRQMAVDWELEVPLVNLSGRVAVRERGDGVEVEMLSGDLAPGRIRFTFAARRWRHAGGGRAARHRALQLVAPADHGLAAPWVSRPLSSPARTRHCGRWPYAPSTRPTRAPGVPGSHDTAAFVAPRRQPARRSGPEPRAHGDRWVWSRARPPGGWPGWRWSSPVEKPIAFLAARLRDPDSCNAFPGWHTIRSAAGALRGRSGGRRQPSFGRLRCHLDGRAGPLATMDGQRRRDARRPPRLGAVPGRRPPHADGAPRLPAPGDHGWLARRSVASEPLLEHALAAALAFADSTAMKAALEATRGP